MPGLLGRWGPQAAMGPFAPNWQTPALQEPLTFRAS